MKVFKKFFSLLFLSILFISCKEEIKEQHFIISGEAQGSTYNIKYIANEMIVTKMEMDSILNEFDLSLSTYRNDSKISKINEGDSTIIVDDYFKETFKISNQIYNETNGLFDPTIGVLVNAYGFGPKLKKTNLNKKQIDSLLQFVGFDKVKINGDNTVSKKYPATYFDFNAIAQGYSVDVVANYLKSKGIKNGIVEIGGEILGFGTNTIENKNWIIGIDDPTQSPEERTLIAKIKLENLGMATSGNYRKVKTDSITGQKFVHIINPKTGLAGKTSILSATVLAPNCVLADGYATAFMLMSVSETKQFLEKHPELHVLLIYTDDDNQIKQYKSTNFKGLVVE